MRGREIVESELRLVAGVRLAIRERDGPMPSSTTVDASLDEFGAHAVCDTPDM